MSVPVKSGDQMDPRMTALMRGIANQDSAAHILQRIDVADLIGGFVRVDARLPERHAYTSTACWHELHTRCRKTCKFCDVACLCECHNNHDEVPA